MNMLKELVKNSATSLFKFACHPTTQVVSSSALSAVCLLSSVKLFGKKRYVMATLNLVSALACVFDIKNTLSDDKDHV